LQAIRWLMKLFFEKVFRKDHFCDVRYVAMELDHQMRQF